jgi:hypothetical protein
VSRSPRDREAARIATIGFLASIGLIAVLTWFPARYLAEWAVYPQDLYAIEPGLPDLSDRELFEMSKWDFRSMLAGTAATLGSIVAFYWLAAFLLGAARIHFSGKLRSHPDLWLVVAMLVGLVIGFLGAARRFAMDPIVEACVRRQVAADPTAAFTSATIHGCEGRTGLYFGLGGLILVVGFMGWSLRLRYRQRVTAEASAE